MISMSATDDFPRMSMERMSSALSSSSEAMTSFVASSASIASSLACARPIPLVEGPVGGAPAEDRGPGVRSWVGDSF
jgi:hypothetical protein